MVDIEAWIEREFAGLGRALRRKEDPPLPFEPWMAMSDAKDIVRRLFAMMSANQRSE